MTDKIRVTTHDREVYEFDADSWQSNGVGVGIIKSGSAVAEFSAYLLVEKIHSTETDPSES